MLMFSGAGYIASVLVPASALPLFYPAWSVCTVFQPVAALAFVTDGIHWGTGDFRFLRNVVVVATLCGFAALALLEITDGGNLTLIWWITGGWILFRALWGILRIWPGTAESPLITR